MSAKIIGGMGIGLLLASLAPLACSTFQGNDVPVGEGDGGGGPSADGGTDSTVQGESDRGLGVDLGPTAYIIQGSSFDIPVTLTRHHDTQGAVTVTASGLPPKVIADPLTIAAGELTGTLTLHAEPDAVQGATDVMVKAVETGPGTLTLGKVNVFVRGAPGALDTTFATQGANLHVYGGGESAAQEAVFLADGSMLVTARRSNVLVLSKFTKDGKLDTTFGGASGTIAVRSSEDASGLAVFEPVAPGKPFIYVLNEGGIGATLYRFEMDGSLDMAFNGVGTVAIADGLTGQHIGLGLAVTAEGKALVLAAVAAKSRLTRWNLDGSLDGTFGPTGYFDVDGTAKLVVRLNGGPLLFTNNTGPNGYVAGLLPTGAGDTSVGPSPGYSRAAGNNDFVVRGPDGSLVFLYTRTPSGTGTTVNSFFRVSSTFGPDPFGMTDVADLPIFSTVRPLVEADNSILFGSESDGSTPPLAIMHYLTNGQLDPAFGNAGIATFTFSESVYLHSTHMFQQADGRILVIGKNDANGFDAAMFRFWQ